MPGVLRINIQGLPELQNKLQGHELYAKPYRKALERSAEAVLRSSRAAAPVGATGQLKRQLRSKIAPGAVPRFAVIKTTAVRASRKYPQGYSYPALLEFSPRHKHQGWMRGAFERVKGVIEGLLDKAAREIERKWGR